MFEKFKEHGKTFRTPGLHQKFIADYTPDQNGKLVLTSIQAGGDLHVIVKTDEVQRLKDLLRECRDIIENESVYKWSGGLDARVNKVLIE